MIKERRLSVIVFSLFFSWLLAFPFEGQVLYAISGIFDADAYSIILASMTAHFIGLFSIGFFIKSIKQIRFLMISSIIFCIVGSIPFFFPPSALWAVSLILCSLIAGFCVAAWGYYFKSYTPSNERIKTAADVLIYSNILMIILNTIAINISPYIGLMLSLLFLCGALFFEIKMSADYDGKIQRMDKVAAEHKNIIKPLSFLYVFVLVITINSGLMYQVINPVFKHLEGLVSWYWAVPYVIALLIMKNLPKRFNRNYILYVGIAMIGLSFTVFMFLDNSSLSYIIINTLMLGACGIFDLFWWSILGEMLDYDENPAKVLGIGLSANVLGVLIGGVIGNKILILGIKYRASIMALIIVFLTLLMLPLLHKQLLKLLKNHVYLTALYEMKPEKQSETIDDFLLSGGLTQRESEIAVFLLKGWTYKMIAKELFLSENTIKTHIKNIYGKFQVQSKSEFITLFIDKNRF